MILVADSGSTKCDWMFLDVDGKPILLSGKGLNPMFCSKEIITSELHHLTQKGLPNAAVRALYFYGAGCHEVSQFQHMKAAFDQYFPNATIHISHDIDAAVKATCGNKAGISCILGTGSNIASTDGKNIKTHHAGIGYILGDEASGAYFGKQILQDWIYNKLPSDLYVHLKNERKLSRTEILSSVYNQPNANVYLASIMENIGDYRHTEYINNLLQSGFQSFIDLHIKTIDNYKIVPIHFVGSIAFFFQKELIETMRKNNLETGRIIKKPIDSLSSFHNKS